MRLSSGPLSRGEVGDDQRGRAGACGCGCELVPPVCLEQSRIRHRHERDVDELARAREAVETGPGTHPLRERALGRAADHRTVGERVGERKAELHDVGAALDGRGRERGRLAPGHQVDDDASSGSMREDLGEVLVAPAREADEHELLVQVTRACERMCRLERGDDPFEPRQVAEGGERLVVVAPRYSARPESRSQACSGPTPG